MLAQSWQEVLFRTHLECVRCAERAAGGVADVVEIMPAGTTLPTPGPPTAPAGADHAEPGPVLQIVAYMAYALAERCSWFHHPPTHFRSALAALASSLGCQLLWVINYDDWKTSLAAVTVAAVDILKITKNYVFFVMKYLEYTCQAQRMVARCLVLENFSFGAL